MKKRTKHKTHKHNSSWTQGKVFIAAAEQIAKINRTTHTWDYCFKLVLWIIWKCLITVPLRDFEDFYELIIYNTYLISSNMLEEQLLHVFQKMRVRIYLTSIRPVGSFWRGNWRLIINECKDFKDTEKLKFKKAVKKKKIEAFKYKMLLCFRKCCIFQRARYQ